MEPTILLHTMNTKKKKAKDPGRIIATNRKARHDYTIETTFEAGLVLEGWEVKSLRAGRAQLKDSYVTFIKGEAWLIGVSSTPENHRIRLSSLRPVVLPIE